VASDAILREVARARKKGKPVVVTMGNVAASGGYFVALSADRVLAQPGTITGSIGVLGFKLLTAGLWGKAGVTWDLAQTAKNANMWSSQTDYTPEQMAKFNAWLDRVYAEFTDKVATGRKLPKERVLEIAKGRVWSGQDALRLGLVDELGGFTRAVESAREIAKISPKKDVKLVRFPKPKSLIEQLRGDKPENSEKAAVHALVKALEPLRPALQIAEKLNEPAAATVMAMPETEIVD
jgi:protease-4